MRYRTVMVMLPTSVRSEDCSPPLPIVIVPDRFWRSRAAMRECSSVRLIEPRSVSTLMTPWKSGPTESDTLPMSVVPEMAARAHDPSSRGISRRWAKRRLK